MPRKPSYLGRFLSSENSLNCLNEINIYMTTNMAYYSHCSIKPIIYYNGRFHFVEEDIATKFHFDTDYALFQIYNFKVKVENLGAGVQEVQKRRKRDIFGKLIIS